MSFFLTNVFNGDIYANNVRVGRGNGGNAFSTVTGYLALNSAISPTTNHTAMGYAALTNNLGGQQNTAFGYFAGAGITTGSFNTCIGSGFGTDPVFNVTTQNFRLVMGETYVTNAYVQVPWTVVSDARDKTEIEALDRGLDFVQQLKPVTFRFKKTREETEAHGPLRAGFLAQDIVPLEDRPIVIDRDDPEKLRLQGEALVPILVNAVKQLADEIKALKQSLEKS